MSSDVLAEFERNPGAPSRYIDTTTVHLNRLASSFEDIQESRKRADNRGDSYSAEALKKVEDALARQLKRALQSHDLWPFLEPLKGLAGARTARVIAVIGDPRRFPGQRCTEGHHMPAGMFAVGAPCPVEIVPGADCSIENGLPSGSGDEEVARAEARSESDMKDGAGEVVPIIEPRFVSDDAVDDGEAVLSESENRPVHCPGVMLEPRRGTGARSIRHYFGLHVVDGQAPKRRKGQQADWNPKALTLVIGPDGLADQIIKHRTPRYRKLYDWKKSNQLDKGKTPIQAHKAARRYAVQEFLADLLIEWKRVAVAVESSGEIEHDLRSWRSNIQVGMKSKVSAEYLARAKLPEQTDPPDTD